MPVRKSATMFVMGGLAVAFLGAAGKDGWELTKEIAKPYFQQMASNGGDWITDSVTPIYDYTYVPDKTKRGAEPSAGTPKSAAPEIRMIIPDFIEYPKKMPPKPKQQTGKDYGWIGFAPDDSSTK